MKPKNYILFLCDDLVLDDLGCQGGKVHTPNIDRIAREGAVFTQHHCAAAGWADDQRNHHQHGGT